MEKATVQISVLSDGRVVCAEPINFFLLPGQSAEDVRRVVSEGIAKWHPDNRVATFELDDITISANGERGVEFMDAVALLSGVAPGGWDEHHNYHPPRGACPVLSEFVRTAAPKLTDSDLALMKPLVLELVNSECGQCAERRAVTLAWSAAKGVCADYMSASGRNAEAETLRRFSGTLADLSDMLFRTPCIERGKKTLECEPVYHAACAAMSAGAPAGIDRERDGLTVVDAASHAARATIAAGCGVDTVIRQVRDALTVCEHRG